MDRGADVVGEAGQGELRGPKAAADVGCRFTKHRLDPGPGQHDRGGEPVGPGPDDDGVRRHGPAGTVSIGPHTVWRPAATAAGRRSTNSTTRSIVSSGASNDRKWPAFSTVRTSEPAMRRAVSARSSGRDQS